MSLVDESMCMEHRWRDTEKRTQVLAGEPLKVPLCISQIPYDWTGIKPGPSRGDAGEKPSDPWHGQHLQIRQSDGTVLSGTEVSV